MKILFKTCVISSSIVFIVLVLIKLLFAALAAERLEIERQHAEWNRRYYNSKSFTIKILNCKEDCKQWISAGEIRGGGWSRSIKFIDKSTGEEVEMSAENIVITATDSANSDTGDLTKNK